MSQLPENLFYTANHLWVQPEENNIVRLGITDFAQSELGDLVYIELPEAGRLLHAEDACGIVESVKVASDVITPIGGVVVEINQEILDDPQLVNDAPYENWLFCLQATENMALANLLSADAYQQLINT